MKGIITHFYVATPMDEYWSTGFPDCVIEASAIDLNDPDLSEFQKTDAYIQNNLKVIKPIDLGCEFVKKRHWIQCDGPSRKLSFDEYVNLYRSLRPEHPLPKGWRILLNKSN